MQFQEVQLRVLYQARQYVELQQSTIYHNTFSLKKYFPQKMVWLAAGLPSLHFILGLFFHGHKSSSLQNTLLPLRSSQSIAILWWQGPWYTCSTTQTILNRLWEFWQLWLPPFPKWPRAKLTEIVLLFTTTLSFSLLNEMCLMC